MSASSKPQEPKPYDLIIRGNKKSNPLGSTLFVTLRGLDPLLQYGILANGLGSGFLHKVGLHSIPAGAQIATGVQFIDALGLSPQRLVLLGMATGSTLKQIFWLLVTAQEEFPPSAAIPVSIFNTVFNSLNSILFTYSLTSSALTLSDGGTPPASFYVGGAMYVFGIFCEAISEVQRKRFKDDPKNAGKPYTGGLFQYARHVNYTGYTFWRAGYSMTAGGWIWGAVVFAWFTWDFGTRAVGILDDYCGKRYGEDWQDFKTKTPYKLIPYLY